MGEWEFQLSRSVSLSMFCPSCNSENLLYSRVDLGIDPRTGYHDTGELFQCRDCGKSGLLEDLIDKSEAR